MPLHEPNGHTERPAWWSPGLAIGSVALALALTLVLYPAIKLSVFAPFLAAVTVSALVGGLRAGGLATVLSVVSITFFFFTPFYEHELTGTDVVIRLAVFVSAAAVVCWLAEGRRRAERALRRVNTDLEHLVALRTAELQVANEQLRIELAERSRLEDERLLLERSLQRAQRLESLALMAGGVAHDFNNLLGIVDGNASLAQIEARADSALGEHLHAIRATTQRARELTNQLLSFAVGERITSDHLALNDLVQEMRGLLKAALPAEIVLNEDLALALPNVEADATQMRQVLLNLVLNAADAIGGEGGTIVVRTGVLEADRAYLADAALGAGLPAGRYVALEVEDDGAGMDGTTKEQIFTPFFTTKDSGHGLGLAAVLGIVRAHGGAIRVRSAPRQGASFTVLLPALHESALGRPEEPRERTGAQERPPAGPAADPLTILGALRYPALIARDGSFRELPPGHAACGITSEAPAERPAERSASSTAGTSRQRRPRAE